MTTLDTPGARLAEFGLHLDGRSVPSESGRTYESIDPYTGERGAVRSAGGR